MNAEFHFVVWPYIALLVFAVGMGVRCIIQRRSGESANDLEEHRKLLGDSRLWRLSLILLVVGHLLGIFFPQQILRWNQVDLRLYLLEGFAFVAGLAALAGSVGIMRRHFTRYTGSTVDQIFDSVFLTSFLVIVISGLGTAAFYRWASSWSAVILTPYVFSILSGRPAIQLIAEMPFLVQLHVFSGLVAIAVFPFTSLARIPISIFNRGLDLALVPLVALRASFRKASAASLAANNPTAWIWPEED